MDNKDQGLTIGDILVAMKKNLIGLLITFVLVFAVGMIYTFGVVKEKYRSSGKLIVSVSTSSGAVDYNTSLKLVQTISELIKTNNNVDTVVGLLKDDGYSLTQGQIKDMLTTTYSTTSFIITVNATYTDPIVTEKVVQYSMESLIDKCNNDEVLKKSFDGAVAIPEKAEKGTYYSPNKTLYMLVSFLVAAVFAMLYVLVRELFNTKFKDKNDVEKTLGIGAIGVFSDNKSIMKSDKKFIELNSREMAPYNKLITNLRYSSLKGDLKTIMFTSTISGELKSFLISNLALVMAEGEKKVCIIDLDFHHPKQHSNFSIDKEKGISEYIIGKNTKEEVIKKTKQGIDVITVGEKVCNSSVIIDSSKLVNLINELKEIYDYVLIDTPPTLTSESYALSKIVDGVIYNVSINDASKKMVISSFQEFKQINANVIGVCLTKYDAKENNYYYYED